MEMRRGKRSWRRKEDRRDLLPRSVGPNLKKSFIFYLIYFMEGCENRF